MCFTTARAFACSRNARFRAAVSHDHAETQGACATRNTDLLKAGIAAAALMFATAPAASAAGAGVHVGTLECHVDEGWGHIIASSRDMTCDFKPVDGGTERYVGQLSRYGVDI